MHIGGFAMSIFYLFFSCNDSVLYKQPVYEPNIIVLEEDLRFDNKSIFENPHQNYINIINSGNDTLTVEVSIDSEYVICNDTFYLEPDEHKEVLINFLPETESMYNTYIDILSNDPDTPHIVIPVDANGVAPVIDVYSDRYLFDNIKLGCSDEEKLYIGNSGSLDLEIYDILQYSSLPEDISSDLNVANNGVLPWTVEPGNYYEIDIEYTPSDFQDDQSIIMINSNDPVNPSAEVSHDGTSNRGDTISDSFIQSGIPSVDILFVIDDSGSMGPFQSELELNIHDFLSVLFSMSVDYNLSFITTTTHIPVGQIIDSSMADPLMESEMQLNSIGIGGSGVEKGMEKSYLSLSDSNFLGYGSGFLRNHAALSIIYVSDEDDSSPQNVSFYENYFKSLKAMPSMVSAYSIIGDPPSGCSVGQRSADFGESYYDLSLLLGGGYYSICNSNWGTQMQNLAWNLIYSGNFELSENNPIESTILVYNNGVLQTDWTYDSNSNSITFGANSTPIEGDNVVIEYSVYESCE